MVAVTPTTLELGWLHPQAEVDRFVVSYVSAGNQRVRLEVPSEADGTLLTDLMPGVEYVVTVTAERGGAVSYPTSIRANTGMAGKGLGKGRVSECRSFLGSQCLGLTSSSEGRQSPRVLGVLSEVCRLEYRGVAPWREAVNGKRCLTHPDGGGSGTNLGTGTALVLTVLGSCRDRN